MANNETTTKFKVDISDLKKAMQEAKRAVSVANSEFKAVSSSMDDWEKTSKGLGAKLTQLDSVLESQKRQLQILENEYNNLTDEQKQGSKAADDLIIKMNNQQAAINKTEKQIGYYSEEFAKAERAEEIAANTGKKATEVFDELGREAKNSADDVKNAGDGFTVFKGVLSNLITQGIDLAIDKIRDLGSAILDTAQKADDLNTNSKITGVDVTTLQEWEYASKFIDTSVDTMSKSMARLIKNMTSSSSSVTGAFDKLGVSTKDANGNLRDSNTVFMETIDALGQVKNETERDNLAMQIFGKSARDLNPLIEAGSQQLRAYGEEAQELGLIMDESQIDKYQKLNDAIDKVKSIGTGWIYDIGSALLEGVDIEAFVEEFQKIPDKIEDFKQKIETLLPFLAALGVAIAGVALTGFISNLGIIIPKFTAWAASTKLAAAAQWLLNAAMSANPITLVIITIAALIAALVMLWKKNEAFRNFFIGCWEKIKEAFSNIVEYMKQLPSKIADTFNKAVTKAKQFVKNLASKGKEAGTKLLTSVISGAKKLPSKILSIGRDVVTGLWAGIGDKVAWLKNKIAGFVGNVKDWLKKFFKIGSPSRLMAEEIGQYLPSGIAMGVEANTKPLYNSLKRLGSVAVGGLNVGASGVTGSAPVGGGVVNNYNQVINSPKQLSRLEIYRQSKNLLGFAGGVK